MLVSVNPSPKLSEFQDLMARTNELLNKDALQRSDYYARRGGKLLEDDVKDALEETAKGTPFAGTIEKISGQRFPDIVAAKLYGVEVKSTASNNWISTGSSILESTRVSDVERIYMTFGKLGGNPVEFISRPYEECLYDIAVTHMPRYLINMQLMPGETIFDKIAMPYDELRQLDDPISPVAKYYRSQLAPGERLWWTGDNVDESVSPTIRLWRKLSKDEKRYHAAYALVNFPEVFKGDYDRYSLWLSSRGVVDPHIRDQFSAGGREDLELSSGEVKSFPGVFRRVKLYRSMILHRLSQDDPSAFSASATQNKADLAKRLEEWISLVSKHSPEPEDVTADALKVLFADAFISAHNINIAVDESVVDCTHCGRLYIQRLTSQEEGFRIPDEDICPYCGKSNGKSLEIEYENRKI